VTVYQRVNGENLYNEKSSGNGGFHGEVICKLMFEWEHHLYMEVLMGTSSNYIIDVFHVKISENHQIQWRF